MAWAHREHSKSRVDRAGRALAARTEKRSFKTFKEVVEYNEALEIINNFRSSHGYPLHAATMTLRQRLRRVDPEALVVSRLKRLVSIDAKLKRFSWLKLSRMQDVGGSRAVLGSVDQVEQLHELYMNGRTASLLRRVDNYIEAPKDDGYRGIHYVYEYRSTSPKNAVYDGSIVEVQVRSPLQHAWATATETVSTFTGQRLKAGQGQKRWLRFFALASSAFAIQEGRPRVPGVPASERDLLVELRELTSALDVVLMLRGWQTAMNVMEDHPKDARVFLLVLDPVERHLTSIPFTAEKTALASQQYLNVEKTIEKNPRIEAVLVKADSVAALKKAYPNYYVEVNEFIFAVEDALASLGVGTRGR